MEGGGGEAAVAPLHHPPASHLRRRMTRMPPPDADERTPLIANGSGSGSGAGGPGRPSAAATAAAAAAATRSAPIDTSDLDVRFLRWINHVKRKIRSKEHEELSPYEKEAQFLVSVFGHLHSDPPLRLAQTCRATRQAPVSGASDGLLSDADFTR